MFCKRLKATMKVGTCLKRQEKALRDLDYEVCRDCPQMLEVKTGKESDRDINRIIRELSKSPTPPVYYPWATSKDGREIPIIILRKRAARSAEGRLNKIQRRIPAKKKPRLPGL